jgi:iron complex transport system ATP-binding protein
MNLRNNMANNKPLLELLQLDIGYKRPVKGIIRLLSNINLSVRAGEIIGLVGRNGCGKSTLLRTIAGLQRPLKGKVIMNDKIVHEIPSIERAKLIGYVSTEQINAGHISVNDLIALGRFPYTNWIGTLSDEDQSVINNAMNMTGVYELKDKMLSELSDGERQKVMIARALAQNTAIIILDEPTAFLDLPNRYQILRLLNELARIYQKTIVYSTHDLNIALHESDKLWLIASEEIHDGAPEDLIITKGFHKLFVNSEIDFNAESSEIRMKRNYTGNIFLQGDRELIYWTGRAFERIGLTSSADETAIAKVNVEINNNKAVWTLHYMNTTKEYYTVYDLVYGIKNILSNIKNNKL